MSAVLAQPGQRRVPAGTSECGAAITDPEAWSRRMSSTLQRLAARGVRRIALYGAGTHTKSLGQVLMQPPVKIVAIVDDRADPDSSLWGYPLVARAGALGMELDAVVLSANSIEDELWDRASCFREAGIEVVRLYDPAELALESASMRSAVRSAQRARRGAALDADGLPLKRAHTLFDEDAYDALTRFLDPEGDWMFIDAGANRGYTAERLIQVFPRSTVFAFEPVGETFEHLRERVAGMPGVKPVRAALASRTTSASIHVNGCPGTSSLLPSLPRNIEWHGDKTRTMRHESIACFALDDWAEREEVGRIDAIKIDVQGSELDLLHGAQRTLERGVIAVYSEAQMVAHYEGAALFTDIDLFLRDAGFDLYQIHQIFSDGVEERTCCCDALWVRREALAAYTDACKRNAAG